MKLEGEPIIQFIGLNDLSQEEQELARTLATEYQDKIQKSNEKPTSLTVHVRAHDEEGNRKKYSVRIKTVAAGETFETERASDWDLARTLHKAFKNMERLVLHRTHTDTQHKKVY